jgi:rRNA maturation RNase YbeY
MVYDEKWSNIQIELRCLCRFCRQEWKAWLISMLNAASAAFMLPGQSCGPRFAENISDKHKFNLEFIIAGDGDISEVNVRNLGCSGPTNILSFPGVQGELGMLFLSADTMEREIVLYGQEPHQHAKHLLAHGIGHILGFDHGREMDAFCSYLEQSCA